MEENEKKDNLDEEMKEDISDSESETKKKSNNSSEGINTDNLNITAILIWGVVGLLLAIFLVFIVSLIAGTLQFILGRLLLFGFLFFLLGSGARLLLSIVSPEVFEDSTSNDNLTDLSESNKDSKYDEDEKKLNDQKYIGRNINASIDDEIQTDPLWEEDKKNEKNENSDKKKSSDFTDYNKRGQIKKDKDYIKVEGMDVSLPNNAELMAEGIKTWMKEEE